MKIKPLTGNEAMAEAMRQINPDVVAAYPITPATEVVQLFASFVADGLVDTEYVPAESEHSALSACISAAAAGARVMTGTAAQGLALMHEMLYIAAGLRLPMVLCEVNRTLSAPINIHCDHSDTMGSREAGWIQIYAEDAQDAYDCTIQAVKISEKIFLPVMVSTDGFIISHCMQGVEVLEDEEVQKFIGEYRAPYSLFDRPITIGALNLQDYFFEHKRQEIQAIHDSPKIIEEVFNEFNNKYNRKYDFFEPYKIEDAKHIIIAAGSTCGTARVAINIARDKGIKVGFIKMHVMRPFVYNKIKEMIKNAELVTVLDRSDTMSTMGGPIFVEIRSAMYESEKRPIMKNYIYGLGGRDIFVEDIINVILKGEEIIKQKKLDILIDYIGVRE